MSLDAFGTSANVLAHVGVTTTAAVVSWNFLHNFANAPGELQDFLRERDTAQRVLVEFRGALVNARDSGLFIGPDPKTLTLSERILIDVNAFLAGLAFEDETKLGVWKKAEVARKTQDLFKYSSKLQSVIALGTICAIYLKISVQLADLQTSIPTAEDVSILSTEISDFKAKASTKEDITALKNDMHTRIAIAKDALRLDINDLKTKYATKEDIVTFKNEMQTRIATSEVVLRLSTEISDLMTRYVTKDDITAFRDEIQTRIVTAEDASRLSVGISRTNQALGDIKAEFATKEDITVIATEMNHAIRSFDLDKQTITEKLDLLENGIAGLKNDATHGANRLSNMTELVENGIVSLRGEATQVASNLANMAEMADEISQEVKDARSESLPANTFVKVMGRLENIAADISALKSSVEAVDRHMREQDQKIYALSIERNRREEKRSVLDNLSAPSRDEDIAAGPSHLYTTGLYSDSSTLGGESADMKDVHGSKSTVIQLPDTVDTEQINHPPYREIDSRDQEMENLDLVPKIPANNPEIDQNASSELVESASIFQQGLVNLSHPNPTVARGRKGSVSSEISTSSVGSFADSIFSEVSSMASSLSSIDQQVTASASQELVDLLLQDEALKPTFQGGLEEFPSGKFERNLRRLLMLFANDLNKESSSVLERTTARFVRSNARRLAYRICSELRPPLQIEKMQLPIKNERLEAWLQGTFVAVSEDTVPSSSDDSSVDTSDSEDEFDELANLTYIKKFILGSKAMETLRQNVREFYSPNSTLEPERETAASNRDRLTEDLPQPSAQPGSTLHITQAPASDPLPLSTASAISSTYETYRQDSPSELRFRAGTAKSSAPELLACQEQILQPKNGVLDARKLGFSVLTECLCSACGFLLPALAGFLVGYYLRLPPSNEERTRDPKLSSC